jgi:TolB-like protein/DNA-binding winged helix-turn-helix (wHTH) protein
VREIQGNPGGRRSAVVRFRGCTFDAGQRQLIDDSGKVLHLTPKAFDLLAVLIESAPRVVEKADLHRRLWPDTFVSDATLSGLVKELRRVLGDRDRTAALVRTSHGVGYAFCGVLLEAPASGATDTAVSVAVLPFANLSADAENDYFADGLSEELIHTLAQRRSLRVASRASAFRFRGTQVDTRDVGRELDVDYVLEGTVRRAERKVRITTHLVNAAEGYEVWSARFDRDLGGVFEIYDEIASSIVDAIEPALAGRPARAVQRHSRDIEAFDLYLRGRHHWHQRTPESLQTGIACFEAAIRLDSGYALAYAGLSDSYSVLAFYGYLPIADARAAAGSAARRALALAPGLPESHYAMALFSLWLRADWTEAEASFRQALEIQPRFAPAHTHYAAFLAARRRLDEAHAHMLEAVTLDPLSPAAYATGALCLFVSGRYDESLHFAERALALHPRFAVALYALGLTCCRTGRHAESCDAFERLLEASHRAPYFVGWDALAHARSGRRSEALALASDLAARHPHEYVHPITPVLMGLASGDRQATAHALAAYVDRQAPGFQMCHVVPFLDDWRDEAPFGELLRRLHFAAE